MTAEKMMELADELERLHAQGARIFGMAALCYDNTTTIVAALRSSAGAREALEPFAKTPSLSRKARWRVSGLQPIDDAPKPLTASTGENGDG